MCVSSILCFVTSELRIAWFFRYSRILRHCVPKADLFLTPKIGGENVIRMPMTNAVGYSGLVNRDFKSAEDVSFILN